MPYCDFQPGDEHLQSIDFFSKMVKGESSGIETPAGVIVECIQGEGGLNVGRDEWLRALAELCKEIKMPLIVDDIQAGCGRSGTFFSFENSGIRPDIITLSKSLSGYGTPLSVVLIKPGCDLWAPGEHNGTFRGNNQAFVTATAALQAFWADHSFEHEIARKSAIMSKELHKIVNSSDLLEAVKGRGMMTGFSCRVSKERETSREIARKCFEKGLILETCGPQKEVVKCLPSLGKLQVTKNSYEASNV